MSPLSVYGVCVLCVSPVCEYLLCMCDLCVPPVCTCLLCVYVRVSPVCVCVMNEINYYYVTR